MTFNLKNVRYLTGFSGTSAAVVISNGRARFITDFRYASQAEQQVESMPCTISAATPKEAARALAGGKARQVGFEDRHLTAAQHKELKRAYKAAWKPCHMVEELRLYKDKSEIKLLQKNFRALAHVFAKAPGVIRPGRRERDVAAELEYLLRLEGAEGKAFDFIVASGKRGAMPHGVATGKKIGKRDFITLDWGAVMDGYHSDNTRNFSIGQPKKKMREIFDIVHEANRRAVATVKPGIPLKEIDAAARDFITEQGYGKYFGHGTGHGVGLDIHENPPVNAKSETEAAPGMVFTIEPGIYVPDMGGVRIEDVVEVTDKGCRELTSSIPRDLVIL